MLKYTFINVYMLPDANDLFLCSGPKFIIISVSGSLYQQSVLINFTVESCLLKILNIFIIFFYQKNV